MLLEKLKDGIKFTNNEKETARYILENLDKVPGMSSAELARAAFTSKAAVVRLSQKLGLTGYQEFRLKLVEKINQKNRLSPLQGKCPSATALSMWIRTMWETEH